MIKRRIICESYILFFFLLVCLQSCSEYNKKDYKDNTPTTGQLKVYYDEGLHLHVRNQARTFESQYRYAFIDLVSTTENEAVQALYNDSCELIVISRDLTAEEKKAFASKNYFPKHSEIAVSGVALITNINTPLNFLRTSEIKQILTSTNSAKDSSGNDLRIQPIFDRNNSSVLHYILDSILKSRKLSDKCAVLKSTIECINYVAKNKNAIGFIDYAWLSDKDDSLYKANSDKIKFLAVGKDSMFAFPDQSSFKLGNYPLSRTVYVFRKTGDFTLSKGFEGFMAGPKGQLILLKQGLLPTRQGERNVQINIENSSPPKNE